MYMILPPTIVGGFRLDSSIPYGETEATEQVLDAKKDLSLWFWPLWRDKEWIDKGDRVTVDSFQQGWIGSKPGSRRNYEESRTSNMALRKHDVRLFLCFSFFRSGHCKYSHLFHSHQTRAEQGVGTGTSYKTGNWQEKRNYPC